MKIAERLGFIGKGGKGSHCVFQRPGEPYSLNFQNRNGKILPYQAMQLIGFIDKYGYGIIPEDEDDE
ncbi:type II toxin-antitoxin system HicA family toxin [Beijerinckia mobilis]|uniref:type II toxin-antitoxin system HicA family toxin n=1 Tax=Beijerinckia mobilis TaxID=231434 RepID=UPI001AEC2A97|nr:type II toxin-antitoxin system HicA family toxin [Beijerinckia mobilis]